MDFNHETLDGLGKRAVALIEKGDKAASKSQEFYVSAGLHLIEAKKRVGHGNWSKWRAEHIPFSARKTQLCIQFAGGGLDLTKHREAKAAAEKERRAKSKSAPRGADLKNTDPVEAVKEVKRGRENLLTAFLAENREGLLGLSTKKQRAIIDFIEGQL